MNSSDLNSRAGHRRHLSESQRTLVAARVKEHYAKAAKERQQVRKGNQPGATPENLPELETGDARDQAGAALNVSGRSVDYGAKVIDKARGTQ